MGDIAVFKATDNFGNGIGFADVAEEFVPQTFTFGCPGDEAGNIDETGDGRNGAFGMVHVGQNLDAVIRDFDDADVRFNRAEWIISRFCSGFGNGIEQGALAYVRQSDNAYFQIGTHE